MRTGKFDSGLERDNNKVLEKSGLTFGYNDGPCKIDYVINQRHSSCSDCGSTNVGKKHKYTADFWFYSKSGKLILIETKGHPRAWTGKTRAKHVAIKKQYPEVDLRFVFNNKNAKIGRGAKTTNKQWCDQQGFECESNLIPKRWLEE
jgi:hypothetical protein